MPTRRHRMPQPLQDYHLPDNSCIDQVLAQKRGIPISMALIYMYMGSKLGLTLHGANLPAHFMLKPEASACDSCVCVCGGGGGGG